MAAQISPEETPYRVALSFAFEIVSARRFHQFLDYFGSIKACWQASLSELAQSKVLGKQTEALYRFFHSNSPEDLLAQVKKLELNYWLWGTPDYPPSLASIVDPPAVLFWRGQAPKDWQRCIAIIGTRKPTEYGKQTAYMLAQTLCTQNISIVSGMAIGIDGESHRGALEHSGHTIAVLGTGLDVIYPRSHSRLYQQIQTQGLLLSEFPPGTQARPWTFPLRNRIVSGLSQAIIVVEAGLKSGTLITVDCALEQNREVFAVPGPIHSAMSQGTHYLIQSGAHLLNSPEDLLQNLAWHPLSAAPLPEKKPAITLTKDENAVYVLLNEDAQTVDEIAQGSKLETAYIVSLLTILELKGLIEALPGKRYRVQ